MLIVELSVKLSVTYLIFDWTKVHKNQENSLF